MSCETNLQNIDSNTNELKNKIDTLIALIRELIIAIKGQVDN